MLRTTRFIFLTLCIAHAMIASGCQSEEPVDPQPFVSTPLPLDPTDEYDFRGWWVGDEHMLVLNRDQSYLLYNGLNQYLSRTQRGRWARLTYASLRLEPYGRYAPDPVRLRVELINGQRTLIAPDISRMYHADAPPRAPEDDLMGTWGGDSGELHLTPDMRYVYTPSDKWRNAHATILPASQRGQWALRGDEITLRPDSPAFDRVTLHHTQEDDIERLIGESMTFERPTESVADSDNNETGDDSQSPPPLDSGDDQP